MLYLAQRPAIGNELPLEFNVAAEGIRILSLSEEMQNFVFRNESPCIAEGKWFAVNDRFFRGINIDPDDLQGSFCSSQCSHFTRNCLNTDSVPHMLQDGGRFAVVSQDILDSGTGHFGDIWHLVICLSAQKNAFNGYVFNDNIKMSTLRIDDGLRIGASRFGGVFRSLSGFFGGSEASADKVQLPIEKTNLNRANSNQTEGKNGNRVSRTLPPSFLLFLLIIGIVCFSGTAWLTGRILR